MSSPSLILVIAEDQRQQQLIYRFLVGFGLKPHQMSFQLSPAGQGSGEQWVRENFARLTSKCRARNARASTGMFVLIDADRRTVQERLDELDRGLLSIGQPPVDVIRDPIARLIPKRNIETWILFLGGPATSALQLSESQDYKQTRADEDWSALIPSAAQALLALTKRTAALTDIPMVSLRMGVQEIPRALAANR